MLSLWQALHNQLQAMSLVELLAVLLAIAYLVLAIRQNIWCWACAAISSTIYVALFIDARLYMEAALYVFYVLMAIYGWRVWLGGERDNALPVTFLPARQHLIALMIIFTLAAGSGWLLDHYSDAAFPYVDSLTTYGAIWATFLVARKVFENWWYWLVIDLVSIVIYWSRDLELTSLLFVLYVALIPVGMREWRASVAKAATRDVDG